MAKDPKTARELTLWEAELELSDQDNPKNWRPVVFVGFLIIFIFFGVFGVWASLAPLGSGAIANGQLQVSTNQKTLQHLEGGIVRRINVSDGDLVTAGQVLIELDDTQPRVEYDVLQQQHLISLGVRARLLAERDQDNGIDFPEALLELAGEPDYAEVIEGQTRLFQNRRNARESQVSLLKQRVGKSHQEIRALTAQQAADRKQLDLIDEEIEGVRELYEKGLERKSRWLALQRTAAQLEGNIGNREALVARAEQSISEIRFQLVNLREQAASEVEGDLRDVADRLINLEDRLRGARDTLDRTRIKAPEAGRIYGLQVHTEGGVIAPGAPILGIVPEGDELIVQVQIDPIDIDVVKVGAEVLVRLTSFSQRTTEPIAGTIVRISADIVSPDGAMPFYQGRIELDRESLARQPELVLVQGMPAMAVISTGEQTLLEYLLAPLTRSLDKALRED